MIFNRSKPILNLISSRSYYYKLKRMRIPPLQEPRESPYIVGPHLKPAYSEIGYITEPIKEGHIDDFDHLLYKPVEKVEPNEERKVKLLLIDDVEGLGVAGQMVEAPYRYGASRLVALKKAEYATEFALNWYKFGPKTFQSASSALSPRTSRLLQQQTFTLPISKGVAVKPWHISLALRMSGCVCPTETIVEDSIQVDEENVKCTVVINNHERVEVNFAFKVPLASD